MLQQMKKETKNTAFAANVACLWFLLSAAALAGTMRGGAGGIGEKNRI
jgi:hypothetical protein